STASITWAPERVGRWLFHCHMTGHMAPNSVLLNTADEHAAHAEAPNAPGTPDAKGMIGMVLGVTVTPGAKAAPVAISPSTQTPRQLRLIVREIPATSSSPARMGYLIQEASAKENTDPPPIPGAPLVLTRGEPTEIAVVNELKHPTAVHWHGIEL